MATIGGEASPIARVLVLPIQATLCYPVYTRVYCQSDGVTLALDLIMRTGNYTMDNPL